MSQTQTVTSEIFSFNSKHPMQGRYYSPLPNEEPETQKGRAT